MSASITVVGPKEWVFDKIVAAYLWLLRHRVSFSDERVNLLFRENQHPSKELWRKWKADPGTVILDLGMEKYQFMFAGSSTERVAELMKAEVEPNGVLDRLIKITVQNNETGFLKKDYHESIVGLLRELYKLGKRKGYGRRDVVTAVGHLIDCWVRVQSGVELQRDEASLLAEPELEDLLRKTGKKFQDFTLSQYILHLWLLGYEVEDIKAKLEYFYRGKALLSAERALARVEFEAMDGDYKRTFARGCAVELVTRNRFMANFVLNKAKSPEGRRFELVMVRRDTENEASRNVVFLARSSGKGKKAKLDLGYLAAVLIILEGHAQRNQSWGRWFYDGRIEGLFNGSDLHGVPCTRVPDKVLTLLTEVLVFYRTQFDLGRLMNDLRKCVPDGRHDDDDWNAIADILKDKFPNQLYELVLDGLDWKPAYQKLRQK